MTPLQLKRWKGFAIRMAWRGWPTMPFGSRAKVAEMVKFYFECYLHADEVARIRNWDYTAPRDGERHGGWPVCDAVAEMLSNRNPFEYARGNYYRDRWDELWGGRLRCCIRAGLDLAVAPSGGVVGFTVGDIKRMYGGRIPDWINEAFTEPGKRRVNLNRLKDTRGLWL